MKRDYITPATNIALNVLYGEKRSLDLESNEYILSKAVDELVEWKQWKQDRITDASALALIHHEDTEKERDLLKALLIQAKTLVVGYMNQETSNSDAGEWLAKLDDKNL